MDDSLWSLCPVQDIDTVLTNRYSGDANDTISVLYCGLYLRQFKESLKLDQESVFEDQVKLSITEFKLQSIHVSSQCFMFL